MLFVSELLHISDFSASFCCTIMFVFKVKDKAFVYRDDFLFEGVFLCHKHSVFKCLQFICYLGWHFFRLTRVAGLLCAYLVVYATFHLSNLLDIFMFMFRVSQNVIIGLFVIYVCPNLISIIYINVHQHSSLAMCLCSSVRGGGSSVVRLLNLWTFIISLESVIVRNIL